MDGRKIHCLVCLADFLVGLGSAYAALGLRFGPVGEEAANPRYLWLTVALPFAWLGTLAMNRSYELRHLFVGNDEYARIFRSGLD